MGRELNVPSDLHEALGEVTRILAMAPGSVTVGDATYVLAATNALGETQLGYRTSPDGEDLTGDGEGDWRSSWLVVGWEEDLGDPLFVDLAEIEFPVYTAMHGAGEWVPETVARRLQELPPS